MAILSQWEGYARASRLHFRLWVCVSTRTCISVAKFRGNTVCAVDRVRARAQSPPAATTAGCSDSGRRGASGCWVPCALLRSCSDLQMPGRPVARVLPSDPREGPVSGHAVVPALLWHVQGLLCPEAAAEELTSSGRAGSRLFAVTLFINTHTSMFSRPDSIRLHVI